MPFPDPTGLASARLGELRLRLAALLDEAELSRQGLPGRFRWWRRRRFGFARLRIVNAFWATQATLLFRAFWGLKDFLKN